MPTVRPIPRFGAVGWPGAIYGFSDDVVAAPAGSFAGTAAIGTATLRMTTNPGVGQTVTIGSAPPDVYEFGGSGTNINVAIGVDAAATAINLRNAINTLGSKSIVADIDPDALSPSFVRIRNAATRGGTPIPGNQNLPLSDTLSGTDGWTQTNLNATGAAFTQFTGGAVQFTTENKEPNNPGSIANMLMHPLDRALESVRETGLMNESKK